MHCELDCETTLVQVRVLAVEKRKSKSLAQQVFFLEQQLQTQGTAAKEASADFETRLSSLHQQCTDRLHQLQDVESEKENLESAVAEERRRTTAEKAQTKLLTRQVASLETELLQQVQGGDEARKLASEQV